MYLYPYGSLVTSVPSPNLSIDGTRYQDHKGTNTIGREVREEITCDVISDLLGLYLPLVPLPELVDGMKKDQGPGLIRPLVPLLHYPST